MGLDTHLRAMRNRVRDETSGDEIQICTYVRVFGGGGVISS